MDFAVVLFLFGVTSEVFGYPAESNFEDRITNDLSDDQGKIYKFPKAIIHNFEIEVNGTLNTEDNTFSVFVPDHNRHDSCRIVHDFKENEIRVSPAPTDTNEMFPLSIGRELKEREFLLTLKANSVDSQTFEVSLLVVGCGIAQDLRCKVNFDELGYIVFKEGVVRINSILFKF